MKKRGFTLIELLAVIVILAIIALIATPIIMNVIENTKEASYDRGVENILHSSNIFAMDMKVTEDLELDKNIYDKIVNQLQGDRPDTGQVYVNKNGEIALSLRYGDYCYTKSYGEKSYYKEKTEESCITPFYYLPVSRAANSNDQNVSYFLNESGDETKPLINKSEIEKIITVATNVVPEDVLGSWSVGVDKDGNAVPGKIMVWYKDEDKDNLYEVYIGQEGGVKANENSRYLFGYLTNLTEIDLSKLDTSNSNNMIGLFHNCKSLKILDLSSFDTSNVTDMSSMFRYTSALEIINLSSFNTGKVTNMSQMFNSSGVKELNLSHFNTSSVTNMGSMFTNCSKLSTVNVNNFNTSNVTTMATMFRNCKSLTKLDLSSFNTSNVTDMGSMFYGNSSLTGILVSSKWEIANEATDIFENCGVSEVTVID